MAGGKLFFTSLGQTSAPKNLLQDMAWRMTISRWAEFQRQHDVIEFITVMAQYKHMCLSQGSWQARRFLDGDIQINDERQCTQPLVLRLPPALRIQSLIDFWSGAVDSLFAPSAYFFRLIASPQQQDAYTNDMMLYRLLLTWSCLALMALSSTSDSSGKN